MSIKYNEFGEVISVNGLTTGQHLGTPMQDAIAERPEDNEAYGTQRRTVGRVQNCKEDEQPEAVCSGGESVECDLVVNVGTSTMIEDFRTHPGDWTTDIVTIASGSIAAALDSIENGKSPTVRVQVFGNVNMFMIDSISAQFCVYGDEIYVTFLYLYPGAMMTCWVRIIMNPDGEIIGINYTEV